MVSSVLAQAILGQKAPDIVGSFKRGREETLATRTRELTGRALQEDGGEALEELRGINPQVALELGQQIQAGSAKDLNDFIRDAGIGQRLLSTGDTQGFLSFSDQRTDTLRQQGRDTTQTDNIADLVRSGRSDEALRQLQAFSGAVNSSKGVTVSKGQKIVDPVTGEVIFAGDGPGAIDDEEKFKRSKQIRSEIDANTKEFVKVRDAFGRIQVSDESAVGDIALIFNFMKMLDPGSVVREGEFATAQNAAGVPDRIRNSFNRLLEGERLNPKQRKSFLGQSKRLFSKAQKSAKRLVDQRLAVGKRFGLNEEDVFGGVDFFEPQQEQGNLNQSDVEKGGVLQQDAQGNRAIVFPDGTFREVK